jgi:hypothetical protein
LHFRGNLVRILDSEEEGEVSKFPETLQSLDLFVKSHVHFSHLLPAQLESLTYGCHSVTSGTIRDWSDLRRLSLKTLFLTVCGNFDVQEALLLPRTLKTLVLSYISVPNTPEWSIRVLEALPQSLTHLRGVFPYSMPISVIKCLPPTLLWDGNEDIDPEGLAMMPAKTKSLILSPNCEISKISCFPPNLESLSMHMLNDSVASMLPHSLKRLNIRNHKVCLEETQINLLPRNLENLIVNTGTGVPIDRMESFKQLPASLTFLRMLKLSNPRFDESIPILTLESSQWLPRSLSILDISPLDHFVPGWLNGLPKTIKSMSFECR